MELTRPNKLENSGYCSLHGYKTSEIVMSEFTTD